MKKLITVALSLLFVVCLSYTAIAGSLDSPGAPSAGSGMYTLQNLYDYLTSGTALTVQTSFQEPTSGPTAGTMKTTKEIGDAVATPFALCATTTAADVKSGKPFFCTVSGSWGVQTGTLVVPPTPTRTPTATPTRTPTITPTPTPVWQGWCNTKGGYWADDGLGGMGCWFIGTTNKASCTTECARVGIGGSCVQQQWNDDSGCGVCHHWYAGATCHEQTGGIGGYVPAYGGNLCPDCCYRRCENGVGGCTGQVPQNCANTSDEGTSLRLCLCAM